MEKTVLEMTEEIFDWSVEKRRYFHEHPELSYKEYSTSKAIKEELLKMGIAAESITETGVVGLLQGQKEGKVLGLRADIDALPVKESTGLPFASKNEGVMHACGHDFHIACLLGAAKILSGMTDRLNGTVKFIFQPAEEHTTGAGALIDAGVLEDPDVDAIVGLHIFPDFPCGKMVVQEGPLLAGADKWDLEITGKQSHGGMPWQGVDANVCAMEVFQSFQTIVSRVNDARSPIVINVGTIRGGDRFNITSSRVIMEGMNRMFSEETRKQIPVWMEQRIKGICAAYGCDYKFNYGDIGGGVTDNDPALTQTVKESVAKAIGPENIITTEKIMVGEDFASYMQKIPGTFMLLGGGNKEKDCCYSLHSDRFKADENALKTGITSFVQIALDFLQ